MRSRMVSHIELVGNGSIAVVSLPTARPSERRAFVYPIDIR
jgi:hypothetical protein